MLREMPVKGKGPFDSMALHAFETREIDKAQVAAAREQDLPCQQVKAAFVHRIYGAVSEDDGLKITGCFCR